MTHITLDRPVIVRKKKAPTMKKFDQVDLPVLKVDAIHLIPEDAKKQPKVDDVDGKVCFYFFIKIKQKKESSGMLAAIGNFVSTLIDSSKDAESNVSHDPPKSPPSININPSKKVEAKDPWSLTMNPLANATVSPASRESSRSPRPTSRSISQNTSKAHKRKSSRRMNPSISVTDDARETHASEIAEHRTTLPASALDKIKPSGKHLPPGLPQKNFKLSQASIVNELKKSQPLKDPHSPIQNEALVAPPLPPPKKTTAFPPPIPKLIPGQDAESGVSSAALQKPPPIPPVPALPPLPPVPPVPLVHPVLNDAAQPSTSGRNMAPVLKAADSKNAAGVPCQECGCTTFQPHSFKKKDCNICYHQHGPILSAPIAVQPSLPPICKECGCSTFQPHSFKKKNCNICYHDHGPI